MSKIKQAAKENKKPTAKVAPPRIFYKLGKKDVVKPIIGPPKFINAKLPANTTYP